MAQALDSVLSNLSSCDHGRHLGLRLRETELWLCIMKLRENRAMVTAQPGTPWPSVNREKPLDSQGEHPRGTGLRAVVWVSLGSRFDRRLG